MVTVKSLLKSHDDLAAANQLANSAECVLEEFVDFDLEISVIVAGKWQGRNGLPCSGKYPPQQYPLKTIVPARISGPASREGQSHGGDYCSKAPAVREPSVEMFATADDIIVNEIAPRPTTQGTTPSKPATSHNLTPIS